MGAEVGGGAVVGPDVAAEGEGAAAADGDPGTAARGASAEGQVAAAADGDPGTVARGASAEAAPHPSASGGASSPWPERAPFLKSLSLSVFYDHNEAFLEAIKKLPLLLELEELEICQCYGCDVTWIIELFATACPQLKNFKYVHRGGYFSINRDAFAVAKMQALRSLQLLSSNLNNEGLTTILDNCPRLESLDLHYCANVVIDSSLQAKCARIKTKKLYPYAYNDFTKYFEPGSGITHCSSFRMHRNDNDERDFHFLYAEDHDSDDCDHSCYFSRADEADLEEHERRFDMGTRRCRRRCHTS